METLLKTFNFYQIGFAASIVARHKKKSKDSKISELLFDEI